MVNYIRECVGCTDIGLPCMGHICNQGHYEFICDWCNNKVDTLYEYDDDEICEDCLLGDLEQKVEYGCEIIYLVNEEWLIDTDALGEFKKIDF